MHGVIEPEQNLVKLTSDDVQQNCAKCTKLLQSIVGFPPKWRRRMLLMATRPASIFGIKVPMTHRYCYEALDRTLQDVMDRSA